MERFPDENYVPVKLPPKNRLVNYLALGCGALAGLLLIVAVFFFFFLPKPQGNDNVALIPASPTPFRLTGTSEPDFFFTPTLETAPTRAASIVPAPTLIPTRQPSLPPPPVPPTLPVVPTVARSVPSPVPQFVTPIPITEAAPPPELPTPIIVTAIPSPAPVLITPIIPTAPPPPVIVTPIIATAIPNPPPDAGRRRLGNGPDAVAHYFQPGEFVLDGQLSEWSSGAVQLTVPNFGADAWQGPQDLSGTAWLGWDDNYLYFAAHVIDDIFVQTQNGWEMFRGDSVELWIDADLGGDFATAFGNADDWQFGFSPGDFASLPPEGVVYIPVRNSGLNRQIAVSAAPTGNGYSIEARIPWSTLGARRAHGQVIGYAVDLSDNDVPGTAQQQTQVTEDPNFQFNIPTTFGNLFLE